MPRPQPKVFPWERAEGALVLCPVGDSLGVQENDLKREIETLHKLLDDPGIQRLVIDLGSAAYFSSIVIGAVMAMCEKVRSRGGRAAFCNASQGMRDIMSIMKLDAVLPYFATRKAALEGLPAEDGGNP